MTEAQIAEIMLPEVRFILKNLKSRGNLAGSDRCWDDMESGAMLAMLQAVRHFNPALGWKWSTYLMSAIQKECWKHLKNYEVGPHCKYEKRRAKLVSLSAPIRGREDETLLDSIARNRRAVVSEMPPSKQAVAAFWEQAVKRLPERHRAVILARFRDELTLGEIAPRFGVTRERIRQIERKCLERLKADETLRVRLDAATAGQISA